MKPSKTTAKTETVGASIIRGMKEAIAYQRGELKARTTTYTIPGPVDVKAIRESLGLSQAQFAARYSFSPRTLQQWEQCRAKPDTATRAYLTVIERNHKAVERALNTRESKREARPHPAN